VCFASCAHVCPHVFNGAADEGEAAASQHPLQSLKWLPFGTTALVLVGFAFERSMCGFAAEIGELRELRYHLKKA
jgi:hypothetical protein